MEKKVIIQQTWDGQTIAEDEYIHLDLELTETGLAIQFTAPFYNDPVPDAPSGSLDGLWDYEVVEVFIAHEEKYSEVEFGPHGHYLLLKLNGVRQRVAGDISLDYSCRFEPQKNQWQAQSFIPLEHLPPQPWTFNAYAIHGQGDKRKYLAAFPLGGTEPDFHKLESFREF